MTRRAIIIPVVLIFIFFFTYFINGEDSINPTDSTLTEFSPIEPTFKQSSHDTYENAIPFCKETLIDKEPVVSSVTSSTIDWQLIWSDEFNSGCLDPGKWNAEDWAAEKNNELQYYKPDNIRVEDNILRLTSKKERYQGRDYTSGAVHTKNTFELLYGKIEMRAKLPAGQGVFPAFWMMTDQENTWLPEIDIMELLGHKPNEVWMVIHSLGDDGKLISESQSYKGEDFSKEFHTFSVEWYPDAIRWLVDDVERFKTSNNIPQMQMYLYLNTAIGGDWPGAPNSKTKFPVHFDIDYVKVYKSLSTLGQ